MRLTKNDDMIQALAADRSDQPFNKAILPQILGRIRLPRQHVNPERQWPLAYLWQPRPLAIGKTYCQRRAVRTWRKADTFGRGDYYNSVRTHRSLHKDAPISRPIHQTGIIRSHPILGGLHHHYVRV